MPLGRRQFLKGCVALAGASVILGSKPTPKFFPKNHKRCTPGCHGIHLLDLECLTIPDQRVLNYNGYNSMLHIDRLKQDIAKRGVLLPIVITTKGLIIDGIARFVASDRLGLRTIPCHILEIPDAELHSIGITCRFSHPESWLSRGVSFG
jgi:hypothetical protein